jgi:hypothetical protein
MFHKKEDEWSFPTPAYRQGRRPSPSEGRARVGKELNLRTGTDPERS